MRVSGHNKLTYLSILCLSLLVMTAACSMPEQPEGAGVAGLTRIADKLHAGGDDAGAADFYQRALQRDPDDVDAHISFGQLLEAHGDIANAAAQYHEALRNRPDDIALLRDYGRTLLKLERPDEAKAQYQQALTLDADDVKSLNGLGISLDYLGQHEAAQQSYKQALDIEPDNLITLNNLAHSYVLVGAYDQAIATLEPHVKDVGATAALRQNLAEAYGMAGMEADAERVGLMDASPEQVKHNLSTYRARRAKLALVPTLYADLGRFATKEMAEAHVNQIKEKFAKETEALIINVNPEVKAIGGTPDFVVLVTGFVKTDKLHAFCDKLKRENIACKVK